jgi:spermidine synthase
LLELSRIYREQFIVRAKAIMAEPQNPEKGGIHFQFNQNHYNMSRMEKGQRHISKLVLYASLFLVSGFAGLIYQVVWEKLLQLYFGVTTFSVTLIVAAYMFGLGLGALWGGHYAHKVKSTLAAYGLLEIGIGLFGLASPFLIIWVGNITAGSAYWVVFLLSFCLLLIPTFLMGATLPFLSQAFVQRVETSGQVVGLLYGINTLGAAFGALISGYILIGWRGLNGTIIVAVILNIGIGLIALLLSRSGIVLTNVPTSLEQTPTNPASIDWNYRTILFAAFMTGFIGLGYEMLWYRVLNIFNKHSVYNFPTMLFVFLTSLAIGGYFFGKKADRSKRPTDLFWKLELWVGILAATSFFVFWILMDYAPFQAWLQQTFTYFQRPASPYIGAGDLPGIGNAYAVKDLIAFLLMPVILIFPAGMLMGGGLPILDRIAIESPEMSGRRVGDIHLANIIGSVLGTLIISLVFLPRLGTELTLKVLVACSLIFFLLNFLNKKPATVLQQLNKASWLLVTLSLTVMVLLPGKGAFYKKVFTIGTGSPVVINEGRDGILAFSGIKPDQLPQNLWIGGEINSFYPPDGTYENRELACTSGIEPKRVLIIGLGGGNTAYFYTKIPGVQEISIVELEQNLAPFLEQNVPEIKTALADPRVKLIADDGRRYLYGHPDEKFDLITTDPVRHFTAGHNNLYSKEAMSLYREHLSDSGVLCAWIDENSVLPKTIASGFPYADNFNDFVIASNHPIQYDISKMQANAQAYLAGSTGFSAPKTKDRLDPIYILSHFLRDRSHIISQEKGSPQLSDLRPRLEYYYFPAPAPGGQRFRPSSWPDFFTRIVGCSDACQLAIQQK